MIPLIFSAYRDLSMLKPAATQAGVKIIDSITPEQLLNLVMAGKLAEALAILVD